MESIALKKLTLAAMLEPRKLSVPKAPEKLGIMYGVANGWQLKPSKFNETQKVLSGRFVGVRAADRQEFTAGFLYLPDNTYQEQIASMCMSADGEVRELSFGFSISYMAGSSPTGYVFAVEPLLDQKVQDALSDVRKVINLDKMLPALAAPVAQKK